MVRSEMMCAISAALISTAFCTINSMFLPFGIACPKTIRHCSGGVSASCSFLSDRVAAEIDNFGSDFAALSVKQNKLVPLFHAQDLASVVRLRSSQRERARIPILRRDVEAVHRPIGLTRPMRQAIRFLYW